MMNPLRFTIFFLLPISMMGCSALQKLSLFTDSPAHPDPKVTVEQCVKPEVIETAAWNVARAKIQEVLYAPVDQLSRSVNPDNFAEHVANITSDLPPSSTPYFVDRHCTVIPSGKGLLAVKIESEDYLGGAHPMRWRKYRTFIAKTGRAADLDGLLLDNGRAHLSLLIEQAAKQSLPAGEFESGGMATFEPTDEFAVTPEGIMFAFQPYELASYVDSPRDVLLPWNELLIYIKPDFFQSVKAG